MHIERAVAMAPFEKFVTWEEGVVVNAKSDKKWHSGNRVKSKKWCLFLMNDTVGMEAEKKMTKRDMNEGVEKCDFGSDWLSEWPLEEHLAIEYH